MRIVFDLDGTLVDSVGSLCAAGNKLLAELGKPPVDAETYGGFVGRGLPKQVEGLLRHSGISLDDFDTHFARYRAIYEADPLTGIAPYPGAVAALEALASAGHALGVCTQKPVGPARAILAALGMMPPIEIVTGGDSVQGVLKPDRRMLDHAADGLGDGPLVYVGDSEVDSQTAANAHVPFVLVSWGYKLSANSDIPHDILLTDFSDLAEAIQALST